jgi:hypothetical protein
MEVEAKGISCGKFRFCNTLCVIAMIIAGCFVTGCSHDDELSGSIDNDIVTSIELEEYIIAASDFKQSLTVFEQEISKVDFSKLEVSYDKEGRKITRLPASIASVRIEEKLQIFNEKKGALIEKYPEFVSFSTETSSKYFQQCIKSSSNVNNKLLEFGINFSRPVLKSGTVENYSSYYSLLPILSSWVGNSNYVELAIVAYENGSYSTWLDSRNTTTHSYITLTKRNGNYYYEGGGNSYYPVSWNNYPVSWIGHTHRDSSNPSGTDIATRNAYPDMSFKIYYSGNFYSY